MKPQNFTLQVLVSTMRRTNRDFVDRMRIQHRAVIVNQTETAMRTVSEDDGILFICDSSRGLSASRNLAIQYSDADILVFADDDMTFCDGYETEIRRAHLDYPDAEIITFIVERYGSNRTKAFPSEESSLNRLSALRVSSVEISVKAKALRDRNIIFDESFGAGTSNMMGEDAIFMQDCLRSGMRARYIPSVIGRVDTSESTWFSGFNRSYFESLGKVYRRMFPYAFPLMLLQFVIRKRSLYKENLSGVTALKIALAAALNYRHVATN